MRDSTEEVLAGLVERMENRYYGKYRGIMRDTADPEGLGRLRALVPSVFGRDVLTGWAVPCVPYGGAPDTGMHFVPEIGAGVWVEFEEGDLEFPIWVGTFWSKPGRRTEAPPAAKADGATNGQDHGRATLKILRTAAGHTLEFDDATGAEKIVLVDGIHHHVITLDATGVDIRDGVHAGNRLTLDAAGLTITEAGGHQVVLGADGIQVGVGATEAMVLGTSFRTMVDAFVKSYATHTHVSVATAGSVVPGTLSTMPVPPLVTPLTVPLSTQNKVGG